MNRIGTDKKELDKYFKKKQSTKKKTKVFILETMCGGGDLIT